MRKKTDDRPRGIGPLHILVVEDDGSISKLLNIILDQQGYIVTVAGDLESAMAAVQNVQPSLVLLDIGLPDGNGLDLLKWIRDDAALSTPVVVLSAFRQDDNVERAFELGANDFLSKPFRPKELMARLERVLAQ
jgi:DNA-binding response OmpR family regulator